MKLEFCSEFSEQEIVWEPLSNIPIGKAFQSSARPTKAVLGIILLLEQGKFPVIKINSQNDYPLKDSFIVHEAYVRCHISVVPTIQVEVLRNADIDDLPPEPEEPDRNRPIEPLDHPRGGF